MAIQNEKTINIFGICLIIILGFLVYANSLKGEFIYDDISLIKFNDYIKDWSNLPKILIENIGAGNWQQSNFNRPLQMITYMLDYSLWNLNTVGYHITNIVLHILVSLCIYFLIKILYKNSYLALLSSLLYVVHPLHTETVAYISGRADSLAALFILLCMILYIKQQSVKNSVLFIFILLSYLCALLSKEYSLITPLLLLFYSYTFKEKLQVKEFLSILIITVVYLITAGATLQFVPRAGGITFFQSLPGYFFAIVEYLRLLFVPLNLHMGYGIRTFSFSNLRVIGGIIISLILLSYALRKNKTKNLASFSILWFFITLLPHSNLIYPTNAFMAEHWLYLPSMGFFLILAQSIIALYKTRKQMIAAIILTIGILFFYSVLTIKQNKYWKDPIFFYKRTLQYAPDNWQLHYNLGINYANSGNNQEAIAAFRKALELNPKNIDTYLNLSDLYYSSGHKRGSVDLLMQAIEMNPREALLYYSLGNLYMMMGEEQKSFDAFERSIQLDPKFVLAYNCLGKIYNARGSKKESLEMFNKTLELLKEANAATSDIALVHTTLAEAYYYTGQYDLAIQHYDKAIQLGYKISPDFLKLLESSKK